MYLSLLSIQYPFQHSLSSFSSFSKVFLSQFLNFLNAREDLCRENLRLLSVLVKTFIKELIYRLNSKFLENIQ